MLNTTLKRILLLSTLSCSVISYADSAPNVLASIKPIQLISQAITQGVTDTKVLLPAGSSPHSYSLKPSDVRKLTQANIIFWVGDAMESFLPKVLQSAPNAKAVALMDIPNITLHDYEEDDAHHDHSHEDHQHDAHSHCAIDPHIWLSTNNARHIAQEIAQQLSELDPDHAKQYQNNLAAFLIRLQKADQRNQAKIKPIAQKPFFVFHDAYGYLQEQYQLSKPQHFTVSPEQQPGAKNLISLQQQLKAIGSTCIFREPQFQPAYINKVTQGLPVSIAVLDPLGDEIEVNDNGYTMLINGLVDNIVNCLNNTGAKTN